MPFPQSQLESLSRQRAEARLGMVLLVTGFFLQAVTYFEPARHLHGRGQHAVAAALIAIIGIVALVGMFTYVPISEWRTFDELGQRSDRTPRP